jgi:hypothetical protein
MGPINPGRVVAHRLNKVEYDNTIRDLIGADTKPSNTFGFPDDNYIEGFDNNADALTASPLLLEKYQAAVDAIVANAANVANASLRAAIFVCDPAATSASDCATKIFTAFGTRAFRRPVTPDEVAGYTAMLATATSVGDGFEQGVEAGLKAILLSPKFLFRVEHNPGLGMVGALNDYEIASRLSYFVWSSMPDADLFAKAASGALHTPEQVKGAIVRMVQDPKAASFVENMAGEWLGTRELVVEQITLTDVTWDDPLRQAIGQEASLFLQEMLTGSHTVTDLLGTNFLFANQRLAQHYGLSTAGTLGASFQKVTLSDDKRAGGIVTQANFLTVNSLRDRTSPTRRGKWISENLLCVAVPPPPPKIPDLVPQDTTMPTTVRERLEAHRRQGTTCNGCHQYIDPLGLAFEHYDAVGRWRDTDLGVAIDVTGAVPTTNVSFDGAISLASVLKADPRFSECIVRKFMTYALGRTLNLNPQPGDEMNDVAGLGDLKSRLGAAGTLSSLVELIAQSPAMTMRIGEN